MPVGLYRTPSKFTGRQFARSGATGGLLGVETPDTPDGPGVIDGGDVVKGGGGG